jgi:hypothetical protein
VNCELFPIFVMFLRDLSYSRSHSLAPTLSLPLSRSHSLAVKCEQAVTVLKGSLAVVFAVLPTRLAGICCAVCCLLCCAVCYAARCGYLLSCLYRLLDCLLCCSQCCFAALCCLLTDCCAVHYGCSLRCSLYCFPLCSFHSITIRLRESLMCSLCASLCPSLSSELSELWES